MGVGRVSVLYGLTIQKPLPQPVVNSFSPSALPGAKLRTNEVGIIQIVLRDYISQVVASSIQLSLNGRVVSPQINQELGEGLTTVSYDPAGALLLDAANTVRIVFSDNANPPVVQTQEFSFWVMSEATAGRIINIDFDGNRNVPGPNSDPLTYVGQGAAAGGTVFNGLAADSRLEDGTDDDNLTVGGTDLLNSTGTATPVSFTVSPMGGDSTAGRTGGNTDDPANPTALWSDYIFNNSSGNQAGQSPFTIDGLGPPPLWTSIFTRAWAPCSFRRAAVRVCRERYFHDGEHRVFCRRSGDRRPGDRVLRRRCDSGLRNDHRFAPAPPGTAEHYARGEQRDRLLARRGHPPVGG